jgi:tetratricopeptide (TPR) repeat protein
MRGNPTIRVVISCVVLAATYALVSCSRVPGYYVVGTAEERRELRQLLTRLEREDLDAESRYIVVRQISGVLAHAGHTERQVTFLTTYAFAHPGDPYLASYLLTVAETYDESGATPFAVRYYRQILRNTRDLEVQQRSVHYHALTRLVHLTEDPEDLILYYKELIARFGDLVDLGETYYHLGRMYEAVGLWESAIQAFGMFLQTGAREIAGVPKARQTVQEKVDFYHSTKDWTVRDLNDLVEAIKKAIRDKDMRSLARYQADASFFTKSWRADVQSAEASDFEIARFLSAQVTIAPELDSSSTSREAYLRIFAAADYRIPVWYLYFRRVDYRPDPEINGNWEWAGIYLGDRTS